jgi:uncharacterized protein (TIRG00374 family)
VRDRIITAAKVLVSLGLIVYLFRRVNLVEVGEAIAAANGWVLVLALLLYFAAITLGCAKWNILLRAQGIHVPFRSLLSYSFIGAFFSNFLPANVGGDVMRGYGLARHTARTAEAAVSVVVDRLVGFMAFMSSAVVAALVTVVATGRTDLEGLAVAAGGALLVLMLGFAVILSRRLRALAERLFRWRLLAPLAPIYGRLSEAVGAYRFRYAALAGAYLTSLGVLLLSNLVNYLLAQSLGGGISLLYVFLFNPLVAFALLIPVSVGGLGVNQGAYVFFYGLAGVPEKLALAVSLLMQMVIYISSLPGGLLWWRGRAGQIAHTPGRESSVG